MSLAVADSDVILDVTGRPVGIDVAMFLKALDRLLTVGAYYSSSHEQYHRAVETQCAAIVAAIQPNPSLSIEVAPAGLVIGGYTVDPHLRVTRQVHDLLVSLNVACLEISVRLTAPDLRQAIAALQAHRLEYGHAQSFRAVTIEDLPPTVHVSSRRITAVTDSVGTPDALRDAGNGDAGTTAGGSLALEPERERFLRELMAALRETADRDDKVGSAAVEANNPFHTSFDTREALAAIQECVDQLRRHDPDTTEIAALTALARQVRDVSGDLRKMRLVFENLRRNVAEENQPGATMMPISDDHAWTVDELACRAAELAARPAALPEPASSSRCDRLAIGFRLLAGGPRDPAFAPAMAILREECASGEFSDDEAQMFASAILTMATLDQRDMIDQVLPRLLSAIRSTRPDLPGRIWAAVKVDPGTPALAMLWPHLANDIILGMEATTDAVLNRCLLLVGDLDVETAMEHLPRLARLPGAARHSPSEQVFLAPPMRVRCLHAALLRTAAADRHAQRLFRELRKRPPDALTGILTAAIEGSEMVDCELLFALVSGGGQAKPSPMLAELATSLLLDCIATLPAKRRREAWLRAAITWLGSAAPGRSRELLQRIASEKQWVVWSAWPETCRTAATAAMTPPGRSG